MVKTVQDNTINIFDNQIYDKGVKAKEVKQKYHQLTNRIKQLNSKITHYQNNDEFAESTKLKSLQSDLEQELIEVDEQLNSSDYKVTEE
ncbi:putative nucleic acid-binding Zn-ribbon protein, partial [Staphylococcus cohnii]